MAKSLSSGKKSAALQQMLGHAVGLHRAGHLDEAERVYVQILQSKAAPPEAQHLFGVLRGQQGRFEEALKLVEAALKLQPRSPVILSDQGLILFKLGQHERALMAFEQALAIQPDHPASLSNRGNVLSELGRLDEALVSYDQALKIRPDYPEALYNRGNVLCALGRYEEALASYDKALARQPGHADLRYRRGNALAALQRYEAALRDYDQAIALRPDHAESHDNRGNVLAALKRFDAAIASYDSALVLRPGYFGALNNRGSAFKQIKRFPEALADFEQVLAANPDVADAHYNRANVLKELKRYDDALAAYEEARLIDPEHADALGLVEVLSAVCDWERARPLADELAGRIALGKAVVSPFAALGLFDDPSLLSTCARNYAEDRMPFSLDAGWQGPPSSRNDKIRIAYLSADFREHATAYLTAELFERHDRSRFDIIGVSFGRDDGSPMRQRLERAFDSFHDVQAESDRAVAELLRSLRVDIVVDLKGYTQDARPEILALRPAPIQVNYLGYPGTMGGAFIDYILADPVVLPPDQQPFYFEKIVHLPDCYQANDSTRSVAGPTFTREELGLPGQGFVFCCFNNNYKITQPIFEIWMRLLAAVDDSVLWLLKDNPGAQRNLQRAADARGIAPNRLVFAERCKVSEHLARHRFADLFLDTLPYNAHTTASDALWTGLPVLTCLGKAFPGRVAASLLQAIGLPELVAPTLEAYEGLALRLATDPQRLSTIREKLARNRAVYPLFDTARFCRHIESAFSVMWESHLRGKTSGDSGRETTDF